MLWNQLQSEFFAGALELGWVMALFAWLEGHTLLLLHLVGLNLLHQP